MVIYVMINSMMIIMITTIIDDREAEVCVWDVVGCVRDGALLQDVQNETW